MTSPLRITSKDRQRYEQMAQIEEGFRQKGYHKIAGVDEAGRGPLAGPVAAAACILDPRKPIHGLNDSKKLSPKRRLALYDLIQAKALATSVAFVSAARIDAINILEATKEAMGRAVQALEPGCDLILSDALQFPAGKIPMACYVQGDAKSNAIAAASILAKVARDKLMQALDGPFPDYAFGKHKGYGTAAHYEALRSLGVLHLHRLSFLGKESLGSCQGPPQVDSPEAFVAQHLQAQGFQILAAPFHLSPFGQIDIVASKNDKLYAIALREKNSTAVPPRNLRRLASYYQKSRGFEKMELLPLLALYRRGPTPFIRFTKYPRA